LVSEPKETTSNDPVLLGNVELDNSIRRGIVDGRVYFSIIDIVNFLMGYGDKTEAKNYWMFVKSNLESEGCQLVRNSNQLKLTAQDGKKRKTECFCLEDCLRVVMSIPSEEES
jgi:hypothetical protein